MANPKEPPFDDEAGSADRDDFDEMSQALHDHLQAFADEHDLLQGAVSLLLLDAAVKWRMTDYAVSVKKPSASGLKLELDRMRRELEEMLHGAKKSADEFIAHAKDAIAEAERDEQGG